MPVPIRDEKAPLRVPVIDEGKEGGFSLYGKVE